MRRCPCTLQVFVSPLFCWNAESESKVVIGVISDHDESGYWGDRTMKTMKLITRRNLLTAAHCVQSRPIASLAVALGFNDLSQELGDYSLNSS